MNTRVEVHCVDYILSCIEAANHYSESLESEELDDELSELESLPDELELLALSLLVAPTAPPSRGFSVHTCAYISQYTHYTKWQPRPAHSHALIMYSTFFDSLLARSARS